MPRHLDLPRQFASLAIELKASIEQGKILHGTANIRDSGEPFETKVRDIIGSRLPPPFRMRHGYLFDGDALVTPQIDGMIVDEIQSHEIVRTAGGCSYLPYLAASVLFEIKSRVQRPKKALAQIRGLSSAVDDMRSRALRGGTGSVFYPPLTVLIIGDTDGISFQHVKDDFDSVSGPHPQFTYLVDRARLIARKGPLDEFIEGGPTYRAFLESGSGEWALYGPPPSADYPEGLLLMWLYFAILSHVNRAKRHGVAAEFYRGLDQRYRIIEIGSLPKLTAWT